MPYSLDIYFKPPVALSRLLQYFGPRKYYRLVENKIIYENPYTEVDFFFRLHGTFFGSRIAFAEFEINYNRPSFFGTEADIELSAFMEAFQPRIFDAQMRGMAEGPYSNEGFLNGWNFGNRFGVRAVMVEQPEIITKPADELRATWEWNYRIYERSQLFKDCYVSKIFFLHFEGRLNRVVIWPRGEPVLMPRVPHVLIRRFVSRESRYGLATWSEVLDVVARAGFDTTKDSLHLKYIITPEPIADWVANIELIDHHALEDIDPYRIIDENIVEAARAAIERNGDGPWTV
jgi:hypothetical protein